MADNNQGNEQGNKRGFAGMDPEKQREIASKGGRAAHEGGNANQFNSKTGADAGRRGGQARSNPSGNFETEEGVM